MLACLVPTVIIHKTRKARMYVNLGWDLVESLIFFAVDYYRVCYRLTVIHCTCLQAFLSVGKRACYI